MAVVSLISSAGNRAQKSLRRKGDELSYRAIPERYLSLFSYYDLKRVFELKTNEQKAPQIHLINPLTEKSNEKPASESGSMLKWLAGLVSFIGLWLTLVGYGAILARADQFGLEVSDICQSPVGFLLAAADFFLVLIQGLNDFPSDEFFIWQKLLLVDGPVTAIILVAMWAIYRALSQTHRTTGQRTKRAFGKTLLRIKESQFIGYGLAVGIGGLLPTTLVLR